MCLNGPGDDLYQILVPSLACVLLEQTRYVLDLYTTVHVHAYTCTSVHTIQTPSATAKLKICQYFILVLHTLYVW